MNIEKNYTNEMKMKKSESKTEKKHVEKNYEKK